MKKGEQIALLFVGVNPAMVQTNMLHSKNCANCQSGRTLPVGVAYIRVESADSGVSYQPAPVSD
jgi:hypothetical protein